MKRLSRRGLLGRAWTPLLLASPLALAQHAAAETAQYLYDPLGRLVRVTLSDGTIIVYDYDAAGNRTRMVRSDGSAFDATLQVTGSGPVNLRTIADQAGYTGVTNANIIFQLGAAVTISGASGSPNGGIGIDTGTWPTGSHTITLALQVSGKLRGGGGRGGAGGSPNGAIAGGSGGDAIYCRAPIAITLNAGSEVKGGGRGGQGAAGGGPTYIGPPGEQEAYWVGGGGGGGGKPNGGGGAPGYSQPEPNTEAQSGASATSTTAGAGGAGGARNFPNLTGQTGVTGGDYGHGYCVRKNGHSVTVTNNGGTTSGLIA